jgi:hypothetical protein
MSGDFSAQVNLKSSLAVLLQRQEVIAPRDFIRAIKNETAIRSAPDSVADEGDAADELFIFDSDQSLSSVSRNSIARRVGAYTRTRM